MSAANDFVAAINAHDPDAIGTLMTDDHLFVDAEGNEHRGRVAMRAAWRGYCDTRLPAEILAL
jgi:uncharacterized protein (TIGR02246 family)